MTLYLPPFYGETTPAPDQRGGVGVDDRLMRQPRLMVPGIPPVGNVTTDPSGLSSSELEFIALKNKVVWSCNYPYYKKEIVTVPYAVTGGQYFSRSSVPTSKLATLLANKSTFTIIAVCRLSSFTTPANVNLISLNKDGGNHLYVRFNDWDGARLQIENRKDWTTQEAYSASGISSYVSINVPFCLAIAVNSSTATMYVNWTLVTMTDSSLNTSTLTSPTSYSIFGGDDRGQCGEYIYINGSKALSLGEMKSIYTNRYGRLIPT